MFKNSSGKTKVGILLSEPFFFFGKRGVRYRYVIVPFLYYVLFEVSAQKLFLFLFKTKQNDEPTQKTNSIVLAECQNCFTSNFHLYFHLKWLLNKSTQMFSHKKAVFGSQKSKKVRFPTSEGPPIFIFDGKTFLTGTALKIKCLFLRIGAPGQYLQCPESIRVRPEL